MMSEGYPSNTSSSAFFMRFRTFLPFFPKVEGAGVASIKLVAKDVERKLINDEPAI
jgi:hypothetical protein